MILKVEKQKRDICLDTLEADKLYLSEISGNYYLVIVRTLKDKDRTGIFIPIECGGWVEFTTKSVNFDKYYEITNMTLNVMEV